MDELRAAAQAVIEARDRYGWSPEVDAEINRMRVALSDAAASGGVTWPTEEQIDEYIDGYVFEGDEGCYTPSQNEQFLIKDAIMGLIAHDFEPATPWEPKFEARVIWGSAERPESACPFCGDRPGFHDLWNRRASTTPAQADRERVNAGAAFLASHTAERQAWIDQGKCPDCHGEGVIGGQFCGGTYEPCELCKGTGAAGSSAPTPAQAPTMADAIAAGTIGQLHAAVDHWHDRALKAEVALAQAPAQAAEPVGQERMRIVEGLLLKFQSAVSNVARAHQEYMGKAMADDVYDRFVTARDETIPKLREELLALLAAPHPSEPDLESDPRCAGCDIPYGCPEYCRCSPSEPAATGRVPLTDEQIEKGRRETFSTNNPFCPCDSKTMRKAVRWAERAHRIVATGSAAPTGEA